MTNISLFDAMQNQTVTTNGMPAHKSTMNPVLDFFAVAGDSRGTDVTKQFNAALAADTELTLRTMLWMRDVRGGAGERDSFRNLLKLCAEKNVEGFDKFIRLIPEVGRWDDLLVLVGSKYESNAFELIATALQNQNALCAKWMPRKGSVAEKLRDFLGFSPKRYRKTLVTLTNVVETQMCNNKWFEINYEHVPSKAIGVYSNAFARHDLSRFQDYKAKLTKCEAKVNAAAVYPYEVLKLALTDQQLGEAQWKSLPDYLQGSNDRLLCVVDVSGSMGSRVSAGSTVTCMDVAMSLGMYTAERLDGVFKDCIITFTDTPSVLKLQGSLGARWRQMHKHVGYSTDLIKVFSTVLDSAVKYKVPAEQMPTKIVILSDMQFDAQVKNFNLSSIEIIKKQYAEAGYEMPLIVYWNIGAAKYGNTPITVHDTGAVMVSGFSPSILTSLLSGKTDSVEMMLETIGKDRYNYLKS